MRVTSGSETTNVAMGLVNAMMDSVPIVYLAGQMLADLIDSDALQARLETKHNWLVLDPSAFICTLHQAFAVARLGRSGPIVIEQPKDDPDRCSPALAKMGRGRQSCTHRERGQTSRSRPWRRDRRIEAGDPLYRWRHQLQDRDLLAYDHPG